VVVVLRRAAPVGRLAVAAAQHVDVARVDERLQPAIDRGEADRLAALAQPGVQLLGGAEAGRLLGHRQQRAALPRRAAGHGRVSCGAAACSPCSPCSS
jgi:hypothetical protein